MSRAGILTPSKSVPGAAVWEAADHVTQLSESKVPQGVPY